MTSRITPKIQPGRSRQWHRLRRESYRLAENAAKAQPEADEQLESELQEAQQERDRYRDAALRARADMENYRKRIEREREEMNAQRGRDVILSMLPILDNLDRAIQAAKDSNEAGSLCSGVEMIRDQFRAALFSHGVEVVAAEGHKFDPSFHEAVAVVESEEVEDNQIVDVFQEGFLLGGRLLRPAMVRVGKKKKG